MNFSTRLKEEIELSNLRYKDLAKVSGVAERALYNYVATKNPSMPPADIAVKIANVLGVSVEYLVTGKVNKPQAENLDFQKIHKYAGLIAKIDQLSDRQKALLQELVTELAS